MSKETKCTCERPDDNTCDYCEQQSSIQILKEAAAKIYPISGPNSMWNSLQQDGFIAGAKWQSERMHSEEDMREAWENGRNGTEIVGSFPFVTTKFKYKSFEKWFEQFKKK